MAGAGVGGVGDLTGGLATGGGVVLMVGVGAGAGFATGGGLFLAVVVGGFAVVTAGLEGVGFSGAAGAGPGVMKPCATGAEAPGGTGGAGGGVTTVFFPEGSDGR